MKRQFRDVRLKSSFIIDWEKLPKTVQKRVDRRILDWSLVGCLPPSAQSHKAVWDGKDILICYITCGKGAYRMFVTIEGKELICWRVIDHEQMDRLLGFNIGRET